MTWFAWRVQRLQFLAGTAAVLVIALWLLKTGANEQAAFALFNRHCAGGVQSPMCTNLVQSYFQSQQFDAANRFLLYLIPGVLGLVMGAPLVAREIEHGTNRLAWTQSITRTHWLAAKLLVAGIVVAVVVGALIPLEQWWTRIALTGPHINPDAFDVTGFVAVGYALFAFMLGAVLGALIRRTGWAIAAGLPGFVLARALVRFTIRPELLSAATVTASPDPFHNSVAVASNAWVLDSGYVPIGRSTPAPGQTWSSLSNLFNNCFNSSVNAYHANFSTAAAHCATVNKLHFVVRYVPESRFWALQGAETAIFFAAALVLLGITLLAVRRWRT